MFGSHKSEDARNEGKKLFCLVWDVPNQCGQLLIPVMGCLLPHRVILLGTLAEPFPCPFLTYQEPAKCLSALSITVYFWNHLWGLARAPVKTQHSDLAVTVFCKYRLFSWLQGATDFGVAAVEISIVLFYEGLAGRSTFMEEMMCMGVKLSC